jgi:transposase
MNQKSGTSKDTADKLVKGIKRKTRKQYSAEKKIRIVLAGLRGEESIAALCRREGISESLYYTWSKEFLEAGKQRLAGDTARQATSPEVKELRSEATALKEVVADSTLENRPLKKYVIGGEPLSAIGPTSCRLFRHWYERPPATASEYEA